MRHRELVVDGCRLAPARAADERAVGTHDSLEVRSRKSKPTSAGRVNLASFLQMAMAR
jgi:hypothetical protein